MTFIKTIKLRYIALMLMMPLAGFSQEAEVPATSSYFSNALFDTLLVAILLLLMLIVAMSSVLKNIAQSDYFMENYKKNKADGSSKGPKIVSVLAIILLLSNQLLAQSTEPAAAVTPDDWRIGGLDGFTFYFMIAIILIEGIVIFLLFNLIKGFVKTEKVKKIIVAPDGTSHELKEKTILEKLNASVDLGKEEEILLDHDYDGIRELDNNLPPWWKYGFYLTIVVAVIYLINFHVLGTGDLQTTEYQKEMAAAKLQIEEFMKTSANNVDESTVKMLDGADLEAGKEVFMANCVACHGKLGEGGVGPNLTDAYWLHSGGIADVFKSIKYGWTDKGMKSWKEDLSPLQIAQVTSYIKTLAGTNPPNAKAAQGDLFMEAGAAAVSDSMQVVPDSLTLPGAVKDSLSPKK